MLPEICGFIEDARHRAVTAANLAMVTLYWNIGRVINTEVLDDPARADYGTRVIQQLAARLARDYGQGFSAPNLWDMRRFHALFQILSPVARESRRRRGGAGESAILYPAARESSGALVRSGSTAPAGDRLTVDFSRHYHLGWTHYRILLGIADASARRFYFAQACQQRWSKRELQRQIASALFERVALSRDTKALVKMEVRKGPPEIVDYHEIFKDPYIFDFLGLKGAYSERNLEAAIAANLQQFLSELGGEFCFVQRQYPMRIDQVDHFLDLLFYHRALRCLVAVDLKIGAFSAEDKGQMDLYLAWLKKHEQRQYENEPVGLILCTSKRAQHVELLLGAGPHKMQVAEYMAKLPRKSVLEQRMKLYGKYLEQETPL